MLPHNDYIILHVPEQYQSSYWKLYHRGVLKLMVMYVVEDGKCEAITLTADTTSHRHITWTDCFYIWVNEQCNKHWVAGKGGNKLLGGSCYCNN